MRPTHNITSAFWVLTTSQVLSKLADRALLVGASWFLVNLQSKGSLALYLTISTLPHIFMSFFAGGIINALHPIRAMRVTELCRSISIGVLAVVLFFVAQGQTSIVWVLIVSATLANCFSAIFNPALLTVPKQLCLPSGLYQKITGLLSSTASVARMLGPIIVLPLYSYLGFRGIVALCFLFYFSAWITELFIKNTAWDHSQLNKKIPKKRYLMNLIHENQTIILVMLVFFIINLVVVPIQLFMPIFAKHVFQGSLHALTLFEISLGCGLLVGGVLISLIPLRFSMRYRIAVPYLLASLFYIFYTQTSVSLYLSALYLIIFGVFLSVGNVITISFYQQVSKPQYTAQIMVLVNLISNASGPLAMAVAGGLLAVLPSQVLATCYACLALLLGLFLLFIKDLKRMS